MRNQPFLNAVEVESMVAFIQDSDFLSRGELRQADYALRFRPGQLHPLRVNQSRYFGRLLRRGGAAPCLLILDVFAASPAAMQADDVANGGVERQSAYQRAEEDDDD